MITTVTTVTTTTVTTFALAGALGAIASLVLILFLITREVTTAEAESPGASPIWGSLATYLLVPVLSLLVVFAFIVVTRALEVL